MISLDLVFLESDHDAKKNDPLKKNGGGKTKSKTTEKNNKVTIIILILITIPKSTTNIHIHHFKTESSD